MQTKTAVLLASFNGEKYLTEQINSILGQTEQDFRLYVHDDGSRDGTAEILAEYEKMRPSVITVLKYGPRGGAAANFFSILERVDADYYLFSDQDDVWMPDKIERSVRELEKAEKSGGKEKPVLVFSDLRITDRNLQTIADSYLRHTHRDPYDRDPVSLLRQNIAAGCTMAFNRACAQAALQISDIRKVYMHDWWLVLTAAVCGEVRYLDRPLVLYRQHGENAVGAGSGACAFIRRIVRNILEGKQIQESRKGILYLQNTVRELNSLSGVREEYRELLKDLDGINAESRLRRMRTFRKYRLLKNDIRNAWKIFLV